MVLIVICRQAPVRIGLTIIHAFDATLFNISSQLFANNSAPRTQFGGGGGAIYLDGTRVIMGRSVLRVT